MSEGETRFGIALLLGVVLIAFGPLSAADWPQLLGPERNGTYPGEDVGAEWPAAGPPRRWERPVGAGFSGPVVAGKRAILFHRRGDREIVECFDALSGESLWTFSYATDYRDRFGFDEGPRATPTIHADHVYTLGAAGSLHAVDLRSGKKSWRFDTQKEYDTKGSFFGAACSPLVDGDLLLLSVGVGTRSAILALEKATGEVAWRLSGHETSYSSPAAASIGQRRHVFFFTRSGLVDVDPVGGKVRGDFPWRARMHSSVNAATPLVVGDRVLLSECYGPGAVLLRIGADKIEKIWSAADVLSSHYVTSVHKGGYLYGLDGRQEAGPHLRCVELASGKARWTERGFGTGSIIAAGPDLLLLTEGGELVRVAASPDAYLPKQRTAILESTVRAFPALAHGRLYARDEKRLVCVDLRGDGD